MTSNADINTVIKSICDFIHLHFEVDATNETPLLGKNATISSLSVMELIAWCEDKFNIINLLEDDLFLDSLSSVESLAQTIVNRKD